jgi:hypothetical protein
MIGKLERVPLREVWGHEAHHFTRWMEQNLDTVNDAIGLTPDRWYQQLLAPTITTRGGGRGASTTTISCAFAGSAGYRVRFRAFQTSSAGHRRAHSTGA